MFKIMPDKEEHRKVMLKIEAFTTEYLKEPLGLDIKRPRFSWIAASDNHNNVQKSYRIKVTSDDIIEWDSGVVESEESSLIEYNGIALMPAAKYTAELEIMDIYGEQAQCKTYFETGLMGKFDAGWITDGRNSENNLPVFFKKFTADKNIRSARLYITALGVYSVSINGVRVSNVYMAPGWTSYSKRLEYQTYDITNCINENNEIAVTIGDGWYRGEIGYYHAKNYYGDKVGLLAKIIIKYADGSVDSICTDESWQWRLSDIVSSGIYEGEVIDKTFQSDFVGKVQSLEYKGEILSQECEPVETMERLSAKELIITPKGEVVLDFGQNLTGVIELKAKLKRGTKVTIRHAEVLDEKGNFYTVNLRGAKAEDTFIFSGENNTFCPEFTFHGFRYIEVIGMGKDIDLSCFTACVRHSSLECTAKFESSDRKVNQLMKNILWGQKGNFLDIPTDCPQRDERLGWTGDAQVFSPTAAFNMNVQLFFRKWLRDVYVETTPERGVPHTAPDAVIYSGGFDGKGGGLEIHNDACAVWGDVATVVPWVMYCAYGDKKILKEQYPLMCAWIDYVISKTGENGLWQSGFQYGDWLALDGGDNTNANIGATDVYYIANAFFINSLDIIVKAAETIGDKERAEKYKALYKTTIKAFRNEYFTPTGRIVSETQTALVIALAFDLVEEKFKKAICERLRRNLANHRNHLTTGFAGTPYLCPILTENSMHDVAGEIFLQEDFPSWLFAVNMGATTIWERWNSMNPDHTISDTGMTSFNHYAYGSIGAWVYENVCGIKSAAAGYKKIKLQPMPIKKLSEAYGEYKTPYGTVGCGYAVKSGVCDIKAKVPFNTTAEIILPYSGKKIEVGSGTYSFKIKIDEQNLHEGTQT